MNFEDRLRAALDIARAELLAARVSEGHWTGELSSSALSTATAVTALAILERASPREAQSGLRRARIEAGLGWLGRNANADGGWGDTTVSLSNISTTTLCWAAFAAVPGALESESHRAVVAAAERWLTRQAGGIGPGRLAPAIVRRYGRDRTFSVPILAACVLSGRFGPGPDAWIPVLPLPFELAALPHQFFAALRLPVVSYALPALIALGLARHRHRPSGNPAARFVRAAASRRALGVLTRIQPSSGGFLEATPLTSFVVMNLAGSGLADHPVTRKGAEFLMAAARGDGSWPIDTNLATWVTTLSVQALTATGVDRREGAARAGPVARSEPALAGADGERIRQWLLGQQYRVEHPYTHAAPGGWAWTNLPGGVPDADDTAGALLALHRLRTGGTTGAGDAVVEGIEWLLRLQNRDGGIPTFCRGWTNLPFDRSAPDLTAHALRAWAAWRPDLPLAVQRRVRDAMERGWGYLASTQRADGAWLPLWFGNQHAPDETNAVYGTARVLQALTDLGETSLLPQAMVERAARWLIAGQRPDGSWGGPGAGPPSVEETALAVEALAAVAASSAGSSDTGNGARNAAMRGAHWLVERVETGRWRVPSPIGFYFAKLWYHERLYPQIFTVAALGRVAGL